MISLILTVDGTSLCGADDFGMFNGILRIAERPRRASRECVKFAWHSRENSEGQMSLAIGTAAGSSSSLAAKFAV